MDAAPQQALQQALFAAQNAAAQAAAQAAALPPQPVYPAEVEVLRTRLPEPVKPESFRVSRASGQC